MTLKRFHLPSFLAAVLAVSLPLAGYAAVADVSGDPTADELLELKAAQAESLETLDTVIESTVAGEDGVSHTAQARMIFDKGQQSMRIQSIAADGTIALDMKVEGTDVSYKQGNDYWKTIRLDAQTQATLEAMGADFSGAAKSKKNHLPKEKTARRLAKRQRIKDKLLRFKGLGRSERRRDFDNDTPRESMQAVDKSQPMAFEQEGLLNDGKLQAGPRPRTGRSRALMTFYNEAPEDRRPGHPSRRQPHDAVLEMVDEDTGVAVETSRFVAAEALSMTTGIDESQPMDAKKSRRRMPDWAKRIRGTDGRELVEVQRQRVLKHRIVSGVAVPEETESMDVTAVGVVRQRVRWREVKVNENGQ